MTNVIDTGFEIFITLVFCAVFIYVGLSAADNIAGPAFLIGGTIGVIALIAYIIGTITKGRE